MAPKKGTKMTHVPWTTRDERILRDKWPTDETVKTWLHLLAPGRTYQSVIAHAAHIGLGPRPIKVRSKYSAVWDETKRLLERGIPMTTKEIAMRTGFSDRHLKGLLDSKLAMEPPEVHVPCWRRRGRAYGFVEVWALGDGPNTPKPKAANRDELNRRKRERRAARNAVSEMGPFSVAGLQVMREAA